MVCSSSFSRAAQTLALDVPAWWKAEAPVRRAYLAVSLASVRKWHDAARAILAAGLDPVRPGKKKSGLCRPRPKFVRDRRRGLAAGAAQRLDAALCKDHPDPH